MIFKINLKMKTFFTALTLAMVLLGGSALAKNQADTIPLDQYLIEKSTELTCIMGSLAQSKEYMDLFSAQSEITAIVSEFGDVDHSAPDKAILIRVSDTLLKSIIDENIGVIKLPEDAYEVLLTRMSSATVSQLNALHGTNAIIAASILSLSKGFRQHEDFSDTAYVILAYDSQDNQDSQYSVTVFRKSGEGVLSATTMFLFLTDEMKGVISDESVADYLGENFSIDGAEVEYRNIIN